MSKRIDFLRQQYATDLLKAFRDDPRNARFVIGEENAVQTDDEAAANALFDMVRNADPTRTGACTQWLIRLALDGRLPAEDLPKARETLEAFKTYKRRLPAEQRDLGRYESLGEVWKAVEPSVLADAPVSGKDEERREREAARAESELILERNGWTVAIPQTERAAKWWGRGTRWCTAADTDNMFHEYAPDGPLVVFIRPDGAKFQWHGTTKQFMDAADDESDIVEFVDTVAPVLSEAPYSEESGKAPSFRSRMNRENV